MDNPTPQIGDLFANRSGRSFGPTLFCVTALPSDQEEKPLLVRLTPNGHWAGAAKRMTPKKIVPIGNLSDYNLTTSDFVPKTVVTQLEEVWQQRSGQQHPDAAADSGHRDRTTPASPPGVSTRSTEKFTPKEFAELEGRVIVIQRRPRPGLPTPIPVLLAVKPRLSPTEGNGFFCRSVTRTASPQGDKFTIDPSEVSYPAWIVRDAQSADGTRVSNLRVPEDLFDKNPHELPSDLSNEIRGLLQDLGVPRLSLPRSAEPTLA